MIYSQDFCKTNVRIGAFFFQVTRDIEHYIANIREMFLNNKIYINHGSLLF